MKEQAIADIRLRSVDVPRRSRPLSWSARALVAVTWLSAGIFGTYILLHYGGAIPAGKLRDGNDKLPGLYDHATLLATIGIGVHFAAGGILLLLGPLQFFAGIRARSLAVHRAIGWLYTVAAMLTGLGGLIYIFARGTIGGPVMSIAFAGYGACVTVAGAQTLRHGLAGRRREHRAWAIRLFALAIGSWLYRMEYGFWVLVDGHAGHTQFFRGSFDYFMDFFFYVPNLIVAELFVRASFADSSRGLRRLASGTVIAATAFFVLATYFFVRFEWLPAMIARLS